MIALRPSLPLGISLVLLTLSACNRPTVEKPPVATAPTHGEKQFISYCAACHQRGGQGAEGRVPPLTGSPWVSGSEERLVRIVLNGLHGPIEIDGETYNLEMPAFRVLFKDKDISALLTHVREQYGAPSPPVSLETVARIRSATKNRTTYWTVDELMKVP